jgi:hypothetical protein
MARATPLKEGEPRSLGFLDDDELMTIQCLVPKEITDIRKKPAQQVVQFNQVVFQTASFQAIWFLNAFWPKLSPGQAERIYNEWKVFKMVQKESNLKEDSAGVKGPVARLFLQRLKRTMGKQEFDEEFKKVDSNSDGTMAWAEYLLWDHGFTPAELIYTPQVHSQGLYRARDRTLKAERAIRDFDAKRQALVDEAALPGVKGNTGANKLAQFDKANSKASLNGDLASAREALLKQFLKLEEEGSKFWQEMIQKEKTAAGPQSKSRLNKGQFK